MKQHRSRRQRAAGRRGAAVVEFAIAAPIFFLLLFSALELSRVNAVRNAVETAAYEGARRGIVPGASADDVRTAVQSTLTAVQVRGTTIQVTPAVITEDTPEVRVDISVALGQNFWVAPLFFGGRTVSGSLTLERENDGTTSVP